MIEVDQSLSFNRALVEKYDRPGPRYTSYPTAPQFHQAFAMDDYHAAAQASNQAAAPKEQMRPTVLGRGKKSCRTKRTVRNRKR